MTLDHIINHNIKYAVKIHFEKDNFYLVISNQSFILSTVESLTLHSGKGKGHHRAGHQGPEGRQR